MFCAPLGNLQVSQCEWYFCGLREGIGIAGVDAGGSSGLVLAESVSARTVPTFFVEYRISSSMCSPIKGRNMAGQVGRRPRWEQRLLLLH